MIWNKYMQKLSCFLFLSILSRLAFTQHSYIQAGASIGLGYIGSRFLNDPIRQYNLKTFNSHSPLLRRGINLGVYGGIKVLDGVEISPEFNISIANRKSTYLGNTLKIGYNLINIHLHINHYFTKYLRGEQYAYAMNNLFIQYSISYFDFQLNILENNKQVPTPTGEMINFQSRGIAFGAGIGYNIFLSEIISLTPVLRVSWYSKLALEEYTDAVTQLASSGERNQGNLWNIQLNFKLAYTILPVIPLCPIRECEVSLDHKHQMFGEKVYRGNSLNKPQNTRIGEKYKKVRGKSTIYFLKELFRKKSKNK